MREFVVERLGGFPDRTSLEAKTLARIERFDPAMVRAGWNEILVTNDSGPDAPSASPPAAARIISVEVAVK
jgi:hypothetical protein